MKTINLRVLYPDAYKSDYYVEVPDEVAEVFETFERMEKAYMQRVYYHKAYYTLDCSDEIEHSVVFRVLSPEEIYERKLTREQLHAAMEQIPRDVVQDRFDRLVALQEQITEENLATFEGRDVEVMITGKLGKKDTDTHRVTGREKTGVLVHIGVPEGEPVPEIGDFVTATVTHAGRHNLLADPDVAAGQTYSVRH